MYRGACKTKQKYNNSTTRTSLKEYKDDNRQDVAPGPPLICHVLGIEAGET